MLCRLEMDLLLQCPPFSREDGAFQENMGYGFNRAGVADARWVPLTLKAVQVFGEPSVPRQYLCDYPPRFNFLDNSVRVRSVGQKDLGNPRCCSVAVSPIPFAQRLLSDLPLDE